MFNWFTNNNDTFTIEFHLTSGDKYQSKNVTNKQINEIKRIIESRKWLIFDLVGWEALNTQCIEKIIIIKNS